MTYQEISGPITVEDAEAETNRLFEDDPMLLSKRTVYRGFRFASRLEARWAFFLDSMSVSWQYEKEAYDLDGLTYIPDFYLLGFRAWLEIKGEIISDEVGLTILEKCTRLATLSLQPVILAFNDPLDARCAVFNKHGRMFSNARFTTCLGCGGLSVRVGPHTLCQQAHDADPIPLGEEGAARRRLFDAATAARQRKFGFEGKDATNAHAHPTE